VYLDYEGPVGGGRGTVTRWDGGEYESDTGAVLVRQGGILQFHADRFAGRYELSPGDSHWTLRRLADLAAPH